MQRSAPATEEGVLRPGLRDALQRLVVLVGGLRPVAEQQPDPGIVPLDPRREMGTAGRQFHRADQVDRSAPLAGPELEHRAGTRCADLMAAERDVRPLRGQARERALGRAGEQVIAGRQHRPPGRVADPAAHRHQRGQPGFRALLLPEDDGGQVGEATRAARQGPAQGGHRVLVREGRAWLAADALDQVRARIVAACQLLVLPRGERSPERAFRHRHPGRADQVLAAWIARLPLERGVEQLAGEVHDRGRVVADRGAGRDGLQCAAPGHPVVQPAQQHAELLGLGAVVHMGLVQDQEPPVPAVDPLEQVHVRRAEQQILQHGVVGEQQVRRAGAHLLPAEQLVRQALPAGVELVEQGSALARPLGGIAGVAAERDGGYGGQQLPQPLQLVVGQGVHRVEQQRPHAGGEISGGMLAGQRGQDRQQEALGLARSGTGGHHQIPARRRLAQRPLLVQVERPVQRQRGTAQPGERRIEHPLADQLPEGRPSQVRRGDLQQRALGEQRARPDLRRQRPGDPRIPHRQQRTQIPPVGAGDERAGLEGIHDQIMAYAVDSTRHSATDHRPLRRGWTPPAPPPRRPLRQAPPGRRRHARSPCPGPAGGCSGPARTGRPPVRRSRPRRRRAGTPS